MPFPNAQDLFRVGRDEILSRNPSLAVDAVDREGTDANALVAAGAGMSDEVMAQLAQVSADQFLDSAEGEALDRLVYDRYGILRKPAANGLTSVAFTTTESNPAPFTIPPDTVIATPDGIRYSTRAFALFPAGSKGPVMVPVRSQVAGADQQVQKRTLTVIEGSIEGAPADLAVTNPVASAGAANVEKDANLRDRARGYYSTVRRGILKAIEKAALDVSGVVRARTFEGLDSWGRPARYVQLVVADEFTEILCELNQVPPTYQAQSQQLAQTVFNSLSDTRAGGMYVQVTVAQVVLLPFRLSLQFIAGANVDAVAVQARAAVVNVVNALPPGTAMVLEDVRRALRSVPGLAVSNVEILSPTGNVIPKPLQVIRTSFELVTALSGYGDSFLINGGINPDAVGA